MRNVYAVSLSASFGALAALPAQAGELNIKLELPEISGGMVMRPYVAVWVEKSDDTFVQTLALWHRQKDRNGNPIKSGNGDYFLDQLRSWWKSSSPTSKMPIDGVSSATRAPGEHELTFTEGKAPLNTLAPGKYQLVLEASREIKGAGGWGGGGGGWGGGNGGGGKGGASKDSEETLRVNFEWPAKKATIVNAAGKTELGKVTLTLKP